MTNRMLMLGCAASLVAACSGGGGKGAEQQQSADVELAVTVARAIDAAPAKVDSILSAHGLTRDGLDSLMYAIAGDSAKTAAYTAARR